MVFDPNMTKEEFEALEGAMKAIAKNLESINAENAVAVDLAAQKLKLMGEQIPLYEKQLELAQKELRQAKDKEAKAAAKEKVARLKELTEAMKGVTWGSQKFKKGLADIHARTRELVTAVPDLQTRIKKLGQEASKAGGQTRNLQEGFLNIEKGATFSSIAMNVAGSAAAGVSKMFKELTGKVAVLSAVMGRQGFQAVTQHAMAMGVEIDKSFRNIMKQGFNMGKNLEESFVAAIDPLSGIKFGIVDTERASRMFTEVGITAAETGKALLSLKQNSKIFTESFIANNRGLTAETTNLIAGLTKIGVSADSSTKSIDLFTKVLKQSPKSALKSTKSLVNIADSLDMSVGQAFQNFNSLMPDLAQFGARAVEVFGNLSAQARATGIEVGKLSKVAMGLDTFQGAAKAAQGLNAVLGGTMISVTDLVHAEPHEKIDLIRKAFDQAGVTFDTSHRRVKSLVSSLLGVDVATASRMFGSQEEYDSVRQGLDTTAASQEAMTKKIEDSMTAGEIMKKSLSSLAGGMTKLVKVGRTTAKEASNLLSKSFATIDSSSKSAEGSVLAMIAALKGVEKLQTAAMAKKAVAGAGAVLATADMDKMWELLKKEGKDIKQMWEVTTGRDWDGDGSIGAPVKAKKAKDLTIFSDGTTYEADKQDNLFLRKDPGVAGGDGAQLFEKLDSLVAAFEEAAKTPIILQQTNEGVILASTEHTIDLLRR